MKLTYIFHSGFVLETEQSILVFDYWMDPSGVMDIVLQGSLNISETRSCSTPRRLLWKL